MASRADVFKALPKGTWDTLREAAVPAPSLAETHMLDMGLWLPKGVAVPDRAAKDDLALIQIGAATPREIFRLQLGRAVWDAMKAAEGATFDGNIDDSLQNKLIGARNAYGSMLQTLGFDPRSGRPEPEDLKRVSEET